MSTGTEAVEGALKLAHRATGRANFVSTENSFHGRTLGALRVIGQDKHRKPYEALLLDSTVVPYDDLDAARRAVDQTCAAFIVEPNTVLIDGKIHLENGDLITLDEDAIKAEVRAIAEQFK